MFHVSGFVDALVTDIIFCGTISLYLMITLYVRTFLETNRNVDFPLTYTRVNKLRWKSNKETLGGIINDGGGRNVQMNTKFVKVVTSNPGVA